MSQPTSFDFDQVIDRREVPALKMRQARPVAGRPEPFSAGVADMDFMAPPAVLRAMEERLRHGVFGYEAVPDGLFPALTEWFRIRHGWDIDPSHILRAPNVLNSLAVAVSILSEPGEGVIVQPPVFFDFFDIIEENGRTILRNPLILRDGQYSMDFDGLEAVAAQPLARLLFLCNPHNPVGRVWRREELERVADICRRHEVVVVADEIHADIVLSGNSYTPFASISDRDARNCITCLSPAKSFNIAACCSSFTIVADSEKRAAFQAMNSQLTVNKNNAFSSVAMEAAYRDGGPWLEAMLTYLEQNVAVVRDRIAGLSGVRLVDPEGTFLLWLDFRDLGLSDEDLQRFLRRDANWIVTSGQSFGAEGSGFIRLNVACPRSRLLDGLAQLEQALRSLG